MCVFRSCFLFLCMSLSVVPPCSHYLCLSRLFALLCLCKPSVSIGMCGSIYIYNLFVSVSDPRHNTYVCAQLYAGSSGSRSATSIVIHHIGCGCDWRCMFIEFHCIGSSYKRRLFHLSTLQEGMQVCTCVPVRVCVNVHMFLDTLCSVHRNPHVNIFLCMHTSAYLLFAFFCILACLLQPCRFCTIVNI